ncbi:hypothetical protein VTN31DRAFT_4458 [Thermomyces dupontii]|uniref:uncharacterized protein n=1 Tax=Talaromyces thermophilus TaxID=28565 RepID=UPI003744210D
MGVPPKRRVLATADETLVPPDQLTDTQHIARVNKAAGNNMYFVELPNKETLLVEMPARFRSTIWIKKGSYVLIETTGYSGAHKLAGEIINVVIDEKEWRKAPYWPKEFVKKSLLPSDSDEEDSIVGKMPPSDDENE